jgi:tetratricopeptide (TPR) repeat protein
VPLRSKPLTKPSSPIERDRTKRDAKSFALNVVKTVGLSPTATFVAVSAAPNGTSPEEFFPVSNIIRSRIAFLTETGSHSEITVTHSKQTTGEFLTGTRIDCFVVPRQKILIGSSRSALACPEERTGVSPVYPERSRRPLLFSAIAQKTVGGTPALRKAPPKLNRQTPELKHTVTYRKQTAANCSNRQKIEKCSYPFFALWAKAWAVRYERWFAPQRFVRFLLGFPMRILGLKVGLLFALAIAAPPLSLLVQDAAKAQSPASLQRAIPELFAGGEAALRAGNLNEAETSFKQVLVQDPNSAGAYANLGVIAMRRQNWSQALDLLRKSEKLAPSVAGIRLNIGLVYYRQSEFRSAIAPFESVVRDQPASVQARYLLGLCYFFTDRYGDAVRVLQDLWPQESEDLNYLYVLGNAADKAGNTALQERALTRFVELGQNTAEYHLLMGKAFLNREENDKAVAELQQAAQSDPNLPFVHFNLGLAYLVRLDFAHAKEEFEKDIALEPDVAFNYDRLGLVYVYLQDDAKAEQNFREALRRDSHLASSYFGLARVYQHEKKFDQALVAIDSAQKIDQDNPNYHNLKGQILLRLGRTKEGQAELDSATRLLNASRARRQSELSGEALPQPELTAEPKP